MSVRNVLALVLVAAIWGVNFVVIKFGLANFPPLFFSALRFLFAAVPLVFLVPKPSVPWSIIIGIGLVLGVVKFSLLFVAMDVGLSAGLASLLLQSQAFFTVILAAVILRERPRPVQMLGMLVAFGGMAVIGTTVDTSFTMLGLALVLAAGLAWGCSNLLMKRAGNVDMLPLMIWVSLIPPLPMLALSWMFEGGDRILAAVESLSWQGAGAVIYISYLTTVLGFGIWGHMIRRFGAGQVAPFSLLVPVFGMSSSALILGESFGPVRIAGALLVVLGLVLTVVRFRPAVPKPA